MILPYKAIGLLAMSLLVVLSSFSQTAEEKRAKNWLAFERLKFRKTSAAWNLAATETRYLDSIQNTSPLTVCTRVKQSSCASTVLPIKKLQLEGKRLNTQIVQLHWETLGEYNSDIFVIERQTSIPNRFDSVGVLPAAGISYGKLKYQAIDMNTYQNNSYYRIREVDKDGRYVYSNATIVNGYADKFDVEVTPNPTGSRNLRLYFITPAAGQVVSFVVTNSSGSVVIKKDNLLTGTGYYQIPGSVPLSPGTYFLKVMTRDSIYNRSFVITH